MWLAHWQFYEYDLPLVAPISVQSKRLQNDFSGLFFIDDESKFSADLIIQMGKSIIIHLYSDLVSTWLIEQPWTGSKL